MPSRRTNPNRSGFTLIETVAAVVILAIGIAPMLWAVQEAQVQRVNPLQASRARWLATEKLEDVIADRHSGTRGYTYLINGNYPTQNPVSGFPGFTRSVSITETAADLSSAGTGYKTAEVTVAWIDGAGQARSLAVSTVLTDYTP